MPTTVNTADEIARLVTQGDARFAAQDQRIAELEARMAVLEESCPPIEGPGPEPEPDDRAPLTLRLDFGDGKSLEFAEAEAVDVGTYEGAFVEQRCLRQVAHGHEDYRDGFVVFFRPDVDGARDEVIVEFGTAYVFATGVPPTVYAAVVPQHLPAYTATITGGCLTEPVTVAVPAHYWATRWRWFSAPRPLVRTYDDLVEMRAILPLESSLIYSATLPAAKTWLGPMNNGGLMTGMGATGDRPDIGFVTEWMAAWMLTGDPAMETTWRANAEAVGSMPFWCRDVSTGALVDVFERLNVSFGDANKGKYQIPIAAAPVASSCPAEAPYFQLDTAHMPSAAYVAWLLTDDPYFFEGAEAIASYSMLRNNYHRMGQSLPALVSCSQMRAAAWGWRDMFQLALLAPESPPSWLLPRSYWRNQVVPDQLEYGMRHIRASVSPCTTVFKLFVACDAIGTFQVDFCVMVLGWILWTGEFPEMREVAEYVARPRLVMSDPSGESGWDPRWPVPYYPPVFNARLGADAEALFKYTFTVPSSPDTPISWHELWECLLPWWPGNASDWTDPSTWEPDKLASASGYLPPCRGALAAAVLAGLPGAEDCEEWLRARLGEVTGAVSGSRYKWAIAAA